MNLTDHEKIACVGIYESNLSYVTQVWAKLIQKRYWIPRPCQESSPHLVCEENKECSRH